MLPSERGPYFFFFLAVFLAAGLAFFEPQADLHAIFFAMSYSSLSAGVRSFLATSVSRAPSRDAATSCR